jgi:hypothetical protein
MQFLVDNNKVVAAYHTYRQIIGLTLQLITGKGQYNDEILAKAPCEHNKTVFQLGSGQGTSINEEVLTAAEIETYYRAGVADFRHPQSHKKKAKELKLKAKTYAYKFYDEGFTDAQNYDYAIKNNKTTGYNRYYSGGRSYVPTVYFQ